MRKNFYENAWALDSCSRHSIFVSQSYYTIKGFHIFLDAIGLLKDEFPDIAVYTTGRDIVKPNISDGAYTRLLRKKIMKYKLENTVHFCGSLNADQMCERYLKCQVFVTPSLIENSSNSIAEALLLGCPTVSSFVGGISNFISHGMNGYLYQVNAPYMLAFYIRKIFNSDDTALKLSENARTVAAEIYDKDKTINRMKQIYRHIISLNEGKQNSKTKLKQIACVQTCSQFCVE